MVLDQLHGAVVLARDRAGHDHVLPEQVDLISSHVAALRRLDDKHGGGALSLRYVTAELRSVADLVQYASYERDTGKQLLTIGPTWPSCLAGSASTPADTERPNVRGSAFLVLHDPDQLSAEAGLGLVLLAERTTTNRTRLLSEAVQSLGGAVAALAARASGGCARLPAVGAPARHLPRPSSSPQR